MAFNIRKFFEGIGLVPKTTLTLDTKGELQVQDSNGKLNYHNGTSASPVVTEAHTATLTNKTIDDDDNTIVNVALTALKTDLPNANKVIRRDAAGVVVSDNNIPNSSDLVTTDSTQTLTNKTIDGDDNTVQDLSLTSLKTDLPNANKVIRRDSSGAVVSDNNLPNSSDLVTVDSTQTLTNKTIDGDDNTIQDLALTSLKTDLPNANKVIRRNASGVVVSGNNLPNSSDLVTVDSTQTLTNKTIDGDDNTVQDLALTSLKTDVANANKVIRRNASGVVISGNNLPNSSDIVTTDASQVITNKDIDGGTASNSNRITLPKNTRTNLNALTRKEGTVVYDTTSNKVLYDDGSNLKELGSGGGELNFLQLSNVSWDAESGVIGFATYKDAAQSRPQDGTGGTASVTITTSNTTPLSGNNSLIISKPSGNLQGEGVSVNFAIDRASRARVLKIEFDYLVNSGTFNAGTNTADSDLIVYIYDVDAGQVIEPSTFKLYANATNIADRFSGYFQTSAASTNYRLIFHVATTNSSAWSLKVDNVVVAPSKYVYGTPITDWVEYTPTFNSGFSVGTGGQALNRWYWRRVGDSIEIHGGFILGSSGGSLGSGSLSVTLPSGLSFDYNKLTFNFDRIGVFQAFDASGSGDRELGFVYLLNGSPNTFSFAIRKDDGANGTVNANFPFVWGSADLLMCTLEAPIQGWASSVKMSDGYDGREIAAGYRNDSGGTVASGALTFIDFNTRQYDLTNSVVGAGNGHSTNWQNTWRYIVPVSGLYSVKTNVTLFFPASTLSSLFGAICVNGNQIIRGTRSYYTTPSVTEPRGMVITGDLYLKAGDAISVGVLQDSGAARTVENGTPTTVSIHRISSPQTIAMGEVVAGYALNLSGQSIPNSTDTVLTSWTVVSDTHAIFNPSTGVLTVNRAGFIDLVFSVAFQQNGSGARSCHIYKNNTEFVGVDDRAPFSSWPVSAKAIVSAYPVKAGDTFVFRAWQNSGSSLNIDGGLNKTYLTWRIY